MRTGACDDRQCTSCINSSWQQRKHTRGQHDILHGPAGKYYGMHFGAAKSPFDERDPVSSMIPRRHADALLST